MARSRNIEAMQPLDADVKSRLQAAGLAMLASLALIASPMPAHAKGGGHGGGSGHGGGGHSSYHSSSHTSSRPSYPRSATLSGRSSSSRRSGSSRRSSSSSYVSSYSSERNLRIYPTTAEARQYGGLICPASLPKVGSKIDIVGVGSATVLESHSAVQTGLYGRADAQPFPADFDAGCSLEVQYSDGTTDMVSAVTKPPSEIDEFLESPAALALYFGGYSAMLAWADSGSSSTTDYDDARELYTSWLEALEKDAPSEGDTKSNNKEMGDQMSGEYWGASQESDEGDQAVRVHLRFDCNGRMSGHGRDGVDGGYRITSGRWAEEGNGAIRVGWIERYDQGFEVICRGKYDSATGKIKATFTSSRNVRGSFRLSKKPSIF